MTFQHISQPETFAHHHLRSNRTPYSNFTAQTNVFHLTPLVLRMPENFYAILGIDSKASETEIRKAYRKLAIKWHPDKNPTNQHVANERFKSIAEAYEVLSDEGKRSRYDDSLTGQRANTQQYQHSSGHPRGFDHSSEFSGRRAQDIFEQFFSNFHDDFFDNQYPHQQFPQHHSQRSGGGHRENSQRGFFTGFGGAFGRDPFSGDDFFSDPFSHFGHNIGGMSGSSMSSSYSSNGRSGRSVSTSTTYDQYGRAVTRKETTTHHPDGSSETVVENSVTESPQQVAYHNNNGRSANQGYGMSVQSNSSSNGVRNHDRSTHDNGSNDYSRNNYFNNNGSNNNTGYRTNDGSRYSGDGYTGH